MYTDILEGLTLCFARGEGTGEAKEWLWSGWRPTGALRGSLYNALNRIYYHFPRVPSQCKAFISFLRTRTLSNPFFNVF